MSLRIQNDALTNGASSEVSRSGQISANGVGSGKGRLNSGGIGGDQIDISSAAESISAGLSAHNAQHAARVSQLSSLYASGQYHVDSSKISSAIISSGISGSITAGKA